MIVARSTVVDLASPMSDVHVKVAAFHGGRRPDKIFEYQTGPVNLDPQESSRQWVGVTKLDIGASGGKIILDITGVGTKIIDLAPADLPSLSP